MKEPYVKIVIPAHDTEALRQYLDDHRFRFVVSDLLNLIRQELKYGKHEYDLPEIGKTIRLDHTTLTFIRKKLIDLADEYDVELD